MGEEGGVSDGDVEGSEGERLRLEEDALDERPLLDGALEAVFFLGGILSNTWNAQKKFTIQYKFYRGEALGNV